MLLLVAAGFAAVLVAGVVAALVTARGQSQTEWIKHTYQVESQVAAMRLSLEEMRSARRGRMLKLPLPRTATYEAAASRLYSQIEVVAELTRDNPVQQKYVGELRTLSRMMVAMYTQAVRPGANAERREEARRQSVGALFEGRATKMLAVERALLVERDLAQRNSVLLFYYILSIALVLLAAVAAGSVWILRRYTHDLNESRTELRMLNDNLEGAVAIRTTDLQRANDEIQRFAYIVSHDLRSPLVNVMGFTAELEASIKALAVMVDRAEESAPEVLTEDAKQAVREDLPEAVGFIRTSTQKMDRLINAILRLSREGRRTIAPEPLDVNAIMDSVIGTVKHRIDELGVTVRVAPKLPQLTSDRLAIEQILSNLVENAIKYLEPGRPGLIEVTGQTSGGRAIIRVKDNGRGIERRDHDRIFDLFRRSGTQDQQGEGIGLAHVRALAYRMGGTIGVDSELGEGSTFTVNMPVMFTGEQSAGDARSTLWGALA